MPYTVKKLGDQYCVYKKDGGDKVGCTDGNKEALRKYMAALHINAKEGVEGVGPLTELSLRSVGVRDLLRKIFKNPKLMAALQFKRFRDVVDTILHSDIEEYEQISQEVAEFEKTGRIASLAENKQTKLRRYVSEAVQKALIKKLNETK